MDNYIKLKEKLLFKKPVSDNAENRYWNSFNQVLEKQHNQSIKAISASNNIKQRIAIANGNTVEIFSTNKNQITQTLSRFKTQVLSLQLRCDSQLLATSHEDGLVNIMNLKTKTSLRQFKNFKKPVHTISFNNTDQLYAAGDDGTIKLFDIPNDMVIRSIPNAHNDFIRCIAGYEEQQLLSSSYDKSIKLYDLRSSSNDPIKSYLTNYPIESILILPNKLNFISAQDQFTTLWDFRKDNFIQELHTNQQTVTSLSLAYYHDQIRIITGSLDHQVKFIRPDILTVTHQLKWKSPVMTLDVSQDGFNIAIGGSDGQLQINQLKPSKNDEDIEEEEDYIPEYLKSNPHLQRRIKNYKFYNRGIYSKLADYDFKVPTTQIQKFSGYDKLLVTFKYKEAILKAFKEKKTSIILSLVEELSERGALEVALKDIDDEELQMILQFILQKMSNPKYSHSMLHLLDKLVDLYNIGDIYEQVKEELQIQRELEILKGMIVI
ncbi:unnamed protein product [Paramecium primaurelia]|uniref:U3 small nucleolar RNA-associated protein 15 C-terminal domain-containing protein n=2 Tax=Paramecium TaxID=5884 RepID=A0A8S1VZW1_9CILI|nr:unnamed protein product [Paramecium primaurelia]CAD8182067.1 unnamed protein product [Paramecium pentaurelia]